MSLEDLDRLLELRHTDAELAARLASPMELPELMALASERGFQVSGDDVLQARERELAQRSSEDRQREQGEEARRLRHFIHG